MVKIYTFLLTLGILSAFIPRSYAAASAGKITDSAVVRYPERPNDISPLLIGETIPKVNIPAANGSLFDLNARIAEKPTILVFYRGGGAPSVTRSFPGSRASRPNWLSWVTRSSRSVRTAPKT